MADDDRGPGFYKRQPDGSLAYGPRVDAPTFTLTGDDPTATADGWAWYLSEADADTATGLSVTGPDTRARIAELRVAVERAKTIAELRTQLLALLDELDV